MDCKYEPQRRQPTRLRRPWDSPGKNTGAGCHFLLQCMKVKSESEVAHSCPTLCDPIDSSPPGSSVPGIFQARVLEWGAIAFSPNLVMIPRFSVALHVWNVLWSLWFVPAALSLAPASSTFACRPLQKPPPSLPVSSPAPCPEICSLLSSWIGLFE